MKTKRNKEGKTAVLWYIAAACSYAAALMGYLGGHSNALIFFLTGSACLCLGSAMIIRSKQEDSHED